MPACLFQGRRFHLSEIHSRNLCRSDDSRAKLLEDCRCDSELWEYAYVPKPGDVIFYDWQDSGSGDNTGWPDHVGIVEAVSGSTITVIEGNKSDSVSRRTLQVNGKCIRGYGVPKYSSGSDDPAPITPAKTA